MAPGPLHNHTHGTMITGAAMTMNIRIKIPLTDVRGSLGEEQEKKNKHKGHKEQKEFLAKALRREERQGDESMVCGYLCPSCSPCFILYSSFG